MLGVSHFRTLPIDSNCIIALSNYYTYAYIFIEHLQHSSWVSDFFTHVSGIRFGTCLAIMDPKFSKSCASLLDLRLNFINFLVRGVIIFMLIFIAIIVGIFIFFITFLVDTHETYISLSQVENEDVREPTLNFETLKECDSLAVA